MKNPIITPAALVAAAHGKLDNFIAASTPGGIEAQEAQGQIEQSFADTLPIEGTDGPESRKQFKALGFVFGNPVDDIFASVTFPKGWRKKPTDHSMWSDLLDDKGRKRGGIFYKAAFYDRSAFIRLSTRYGLNNYHSTGVKDEFANVITEFGQVIETHSTWKIDESRESVRKKQDGARKRLEERFPNHADVMAYWD